MAEASCSPSCHKNIYDGTKLKQTDAYAFCHATNTQNWSHDNRWQTLVLLFWQQVSALWQESMGSLELPALCSCLGQVLPGLPGADPAHPGSSAGMHMKPLECLSRFLCWQTHSLRIPQEGLPGYAYCTAMFASPSKMDQLCYNKPQHG